MKKLIIIALIVFSGWNYYYPKNVVTQQPVNAAPVVINEESDALVAQYFSCDGRQHYSQMRSFAEAEYSLRNCLV